MSATIPTSSFAGSGPRRFALFDYGFRPFFLLAGVYALISMPIWMWIYTHGTMMPSKLPPHLWHGHEMIFGFAMAAIAGFLLTAVPSWTASRGFAGRPLIILTTLWIAGRVACSTGDLLPMWLVATVELSLLPALALTLAPPLLRAPNRNTPMLLVLGILWLIDAAFLIAAAKGDALLAQRASHLAINCVLILVTLIGGRIVPAFTANALRRRGDVVRIVARPWLDRTVIGLMILIAIADAFGATELVAGTLAALAAAAHALRLAGWHGFKTLREPIVWALHVGYAWLAIGFALKALWLLSRVPWSMHWLHALTAGVFGMMILAVMTRASLGHTGRPLVVSRLVVVAYLALTAAVIVRVFGSVVGVLQYGQAVVVAGALWSVAFMIYVLTYAPILIGPRADGKPG